MLKQHIKSSGRPRADWARQLGVSEAYLSQLINNRKRPSLDLAIRIERITDGAVPARSWAVPESGEAA